MALPNRLFYSLSEAAEFLTANNHKCSVGDLLHFADIGMLEICFPVTGSWRAEFDTLTYYQEGERPPLVFEPHINSACQHPCSTNNIYSAKELDISTSALFVTADKNLNFPEDECTLLNGYRYLSIDGLMSMSCIYKSVAFYDFLKHGYSSSSNFHLSTPRTMNRNNFKDLFHISFDVIPFNIHMVDLLITSEELELLKNGGKDCSAGVLMGAIAKQLHIKPPAPKTVNSQARVIKSLLEVCFGKNVANHPRNAIDNTNSNLNIAFQKAGVKFPASGVAVEGWLKNIEE